MVLMLALLLTLLVAQNVPATAGTAVVCPAEGSAHADQIMEQFVVSIMGNKGSALNKKSNDIIAGLHAGGEIVAPTTLQAKLDACDQRFPQTGGGWLRQGCKFYINTKWGFCVPAAEATVGGAEGAQAAPSAPRVVYDHTRKDNKACKPADEISEEIAKEQATDTEQIRGFKAEFKEGVTAAKALSLPPTGSQQDLRALCRDLTPMWRKSGCEQWLNSLIDLCGLFGETLNTPPGFVPPPAEASPVPPPAEASLAGFAKGGRSSKQGASPVAPAVQPANPAAHAPCSGGDNCSGCTRVENNVGQYVDLAGDQCSRMDTVCLTLATARFPNALCGTEASSSPPQIRDPAIIGSVSRLLPARSHSGAPPRNPPAQSGPLPPVQEEHIGTFGTRVGVSNQTATKTGVFFLVAGLCATIWFCGMSTKKHSYTSLLDDVAGEI